MDLGLPVPDLLARRAQDLLIALWATKHEAKKNKSDAEQASGHIVIDCHIALDPETGEITAERLGGNDKHDCCQVNPLLEEMIETTGRLTKVGGAYDTWKSYGAIEAVGARPVIPPQKNALVRKHGSTKRPRLSLMKRFARWVSRLEPGGNGCRLASA